MYRKRLSKKPSKLYRDEAVSKSSSFEIRNSPYSTAVHNLKNEQWWQVQSAHYVYFALQKSANFQWKPGVDVSGLRN